MQRNLQKTKIKRFFKGIDFNKYLENNNIKVGDQTVDEDRPAYNPLN